MKKVNHIHFTDANGKEFFIEVEIENGQLSKVNRVSKNKEEITDVRFYLEGDFDLESNG